MSTKTANTAAKTNTVATAPAKQSLQRQCACGNHTAAGVECASCAAKKLQKKLSIGATNDPLELEADRVAEQVLAYQPTHSFSNISAPKIQRRAEQPSAQTEVVPASVERVLASSGSPLPITVRKDMEQRFGQDFSQVRMHTGSTAEQSASDVSANAYTVGNSIVFNRGMFSPDTQNGKRLLAHELTHVVQQSGNNQPFIQRSLAGCQDLIANDSGVSLVSGSVVHRIIGSHFQRTVAGARNIVIPGASAGPLRSQGICGGDDKVINPQMVGGMSGGGIPDLARLTPNGILQVAEIKPAAIPCLIDGEEQELRYIDQGNARDNTQVAWRSSLGITVVSPMSESTYSPPNFIISIPGVARAELKTAWCGPGLMAYSVSLSGEQVKVRVPQNRRNEERQRLRSGSGGAVPAMVAVGATAVVAVAGRALWKHFWRAVIERFAIRGAVALGLSAADGPLPFGELISLGMAVVTVVQIVNDWNDLWKEADKIAADGA